MKWKNRTKKNRTNRKMSKVKKIGIISTVIVLVVVASVASILKYKNKNKSKVSVYPVSMLNSADWWDDGSALTGTLSSDYVQEVHVDSGKEVKKIYVKQGQTVKEGDKLLKYNVDEEEINLKLQELQIKKANIDIANMQKELDKLKNTKTVGSIDGTGNQTANAAVNLSGIKGDAMMLLASNTSGSTDEKTTEAKKTARAPETTTESKSETTTESNPATTTESKPTTTTSDNPATTTESNPATTTESNPATTTSDNPATTTESKPTTTTSDNPATTTSDKPETTTESKPTTTSDKPTTTVIGGVDTSDAPHSGTIDSVKDKARKSSGNGKSADKPYVYLMVKNAQKESIHIKGSVINQLMKDGIYAVFKEYDSLAKYYSAPDKPSSEIYISPDTIFSENISEKASYTIVDLESMVITVKKISIIPKRKKVTTGKTYSFGVKLTGNHVKSATVIWTVKKNKCKDTTISNGVLDVAEGETAKKIIIVATSGNISDSMTLKVKQDTSSGSEGTGGDTGSGDIGGDEGDAGDVGGDAGGDAGGEDIPPTAEELKDQISEKEDELAQAKEDLSEAKINYKEAKTEVDAAIIKSTVSGKVTVAYSADALPSGDTPVIVVRADNGIYVKTQVSEMLLDTVKVGGTITCTSWSNDQKYKATIKEISDYPVASSAEEASNPNSSYYPIVAYIAKAEGLSPGEQVNITYSSQSMGTVDANAVYLQKAYVRSDGGGSYVFKSDEKGKLRKQYVKTGETMYGQYIEIISGITMDDNIAFPYGKNVKEGAKTKVSESEDGIIY